MNKLWMSAVVQARVLAATAVPPCVLAVTIAHAQTHPVTLATTPGTGSAQAQQAAAQDALFASWDTNHDKTLSREEFAAGWQSLQATRALRRLHEQFAAMDTSKNDCLEAAEYARLELIKNAGKSAPPLTTYDADKTQCLNFKEYLGLVQSLMQHAPK